MEDIPIRKFVGDIWFKRKTDDELRKSPSFNLVDANGEFIGIMIIPASGEKKHQFQSQAQQGNVAIFGEG